MLATEIANEVDDTLITAGLENALVITLNRDDRSTPQPGRG